MQGITALGGVVRILELDGTTVPLQWTVDTAAMFSRKALDCNLQ